MSLTYSLPEQIGACGEKTKCESCGGDFLCGATLAGCWCAEIKLDEAQLTEIRSRYRNCLCRPCLERVVKELITNDKKEE